MINSRLQWILKLDYMLLRVLVFFALIGAISIAVYSTVLLTANIAEEYNPGIVLQQGVEEIQAVKQQLENNDSEILQEDEK